MAKHLGRVPIPGAEVVYGGLRFRAESLAGRRNKVVTVVVTPELSEQTPSTPGRRRARGCPVRGAATDRWLSACLDVWPHRPTRRCRSAADSRASSAGPTPASRRSPTPWWAARSPSPRAKPQTTRHAIRGIVHRPDAQLVLVDTPGLHKPRTLLGERLNDLVRGTWSEVDLIIVCLPASDAIGPGDRFLVGEVAKVSRTPKLAVATKTDLVAPERLIQHLAQVQALGERPRVRLGGDRPGVRRLRPPGGPAPGHPAEAAARGSAAVPGRRPHGRARADPGRRADPGGGAGGRS